MPIPSFDLDGVLPPGDHEVTLEEISQSVLIGGPATAVPGWDKEWRQHLTDNLGIIVKQLWTIGIFGIYVDGSYAEDRLHPNDVDVYFECDRKYLISGQLENDLNRIDPYKCWTWDPSRRIRDQATGKGQLPMWWEYRVEAWPHYGQGSGVIHPETLEELTHAELFRISREGAKPKGIIKLIRS